MEVKYDNYYINIMLGRNINVGDILKKGSSGHFYKFSNVTNNFEIDVANSVTKNRTNEILVKSIENINFGSKNTCYCKFNYLDDIYKQIETSSKKWQGDFYLVIETVKADHTVIYVNGAKCTECEDNNTVLYKVAKRKCNLFTLFKPKWKIV